MKNIVRSGKGQRYKFYAVFNRYLISSNRKGNTIRLEFINVTDMECRVITPVIVFDYADTFMKLNLVEGDIVSFEARMVEYIETVPTYYGFRSYAKLEKIPRLFYPSKARKLKRVVTRYIPEDNSLPQSDFIIQVPGRR